MINSYITDALKLAPQVAVLLFHDGYWLITYETVFSIALTIGIYSISYSNYLTPGIYSTFYLSDFNDCNGFEI